MTRQRGGGIVYKRGSWWWIQFYRDGRKFRESVARSLGKLAGDVKEKDARGLLNHRMGAIAGGQPVAVRAERVRVGELLDDLLQEYTINGRRSIERAQYSVAHLREYFGDARAQALDTAQIRGYIAQRQTAKAANATVNRELAALKRALNLACQARKIVMRPHVPMLVENNARSGFFEREQLEAVLRYLPPAVRPLASFAFITGWRSSEIKGLTWRQVDFPAASVRLEPGTTKNGDGRVFPMVPELRAMLEAQRTATDTLQRTTGRIIPYVFHRDGQPIKSFQRAWRTACSKAGVPGRIFHDFRRTAVRSLERAAVPRSVAMRMIGHRTEAVYRRYAIVSDSDLRAAAVKLAEASAAESSARATVLTGTISGTFGHGGRR